MNCPNCQKPLHEDFKFCPHCGVETNKNSNCFSCQKQVEPGWLSCPYCGAALKARNQHVKEYPPQIPPQNYQQNPNQPQFSHGNHHGSSSPKRRRKGFLGGFFSS